MSVRIDIKKLTIDAIGQAMGTDYFPGSGEHNGTLEDIASYKLVDVGKDVEDAGSLDKFTNALIGVIGKMVIDTRRYVPVMPSIIKDTFEYGAFVEKVRLGLYEISDDPMLNLVNGTSYADIEHKFVAPTTFAKIYEEKKSIMVQKSVQREELMEAFTSWDKMGEFINAMSIKVEDTITQAINVWAHMLVSCAIAVSDEGTGTARHLLTEAIAKGILASGSTAEDFMQSKEAMAYALEEMANTKQYMRDMSTCYNNKTVPTYTPVDDNKLVLLTAFAHANKFRVLANTYNEKDLGIGDYELINSWQAVHSQTEDDDAVVDSYYDFETVSSIKISADANNKLGIGSSTYENSNIIGLMYDSMALGICPWKRKVTSSYTAAADFWNEFYHQICNYWLDSSYGMVAFILD